MSGIFSKNETINALKAIFEKHKHERVCVIGTMCCGKTSLLKELSQYHCVDVDDIFWPQISEKEIEALSETPITKEIMDEIYKLVHEKINVKPGFPLFGFAIHDCEAVVYLDISETLLEKHCQTRGDTSLADALFVKKCVEEDWNEHKAKNLKVFYYLTIVE
jgi:adenylate kinase family enzyme